MNIKRMRSINDRFAYLKNQVYVLIYNLCFIGYNKKEILEEDIEMCQMLSNDVILMLINSCSYDDLLHKFKSDVTLYNCFSIKIHDKYAMEVSKKLMLLQVEIQKYDVLARNEKIAFPDNEIRRLDALSNELDEYLDIAIDEPSKI